MLPKYRSCGPRISGQSLVKTPFGEFANVKPYRLCATGKIAAVALLRNLAWGPIERAESASGCPYGLPDRRQRKNRFNAENRHAPHKPVVWRKSKTTVLVKPINRLVSINRARRVVRALPPRMSVQQWIADDRDLRWGRHPPTWPLRFFAPIALVRACIATVILFLPLGPHGSWAQDVNAPIGTGSHSTNAGKNTPFAWEKTTRTLFGAAPEKTASSAPQKNPLQKPKPQSSVVQSAPPPIELAEPVPANLSKKATTTQPVSDGVGETRLQNLVGSEFQQVTSVELTQQEPGELPHTTPTSDFVPTNEPFLFQPGQDPEFQPDGGVDAPWWRPLVCESMFTTLGEPITPDFLVYSALQNSPYIRVISRDPLIREQEVVEKSAEFDPELFAKSLYDDRVDPVGNLLTTGGLPFLKDNIWTGSVGARRKLQTGADVEVSQRFGFQNSNSRFFSPQDQGTATLAIGLNQPLLKGGGRLYNRSQIMIAQSSQQAAWETFLANFQDELIKIGEAYWNLGYRRSVLLQKQRNVQRGADVLAKLEGRAELDSVPSQILRAQAAVSSRKTELSNALRDVENAQTEIRRLVGDCQSLKTVDVELIPAEPPIHDYVPQQMDQLVQVAVQNRPEIREAVQRAKIAAIESDIGRNEMLPELNLIFKTYVAALEPESQVLEAWQQQFVNSTPGYAAGLEYSVPYGRRAARSRYTQTRLQVCKVNEEVEVVLLNVISETQIAARRLDSAYKTMLAARAAIDASNADLEYQNQRWEAFALVEGDFAEGQTPVTMLDQLLDAQQRLSNAESIYSQAEFEFKKAEIALKRAEGTLLQHAQVEFSATCIDGLPSLQIDQSNR